ncbi:MAG: hypothetical protein JXQ76_02710 [Campylobacterales bacterium]|nr:hypothetical protein [Campylobacterales bacterium]
MDYTIPNVNIEHFTERAKMAEGDFSTLFMVLSPTILHSKPLLFAKLADFYTLENATEYPPFLKRAVEAFFQNGGTLLYLFFYPLSHQKFDLNAFEKRLIQACDTLIDVEVISAINLYSQEVYPSYLKMGEIVQIQRTINDYCYKSDRISLSDMHAQFKDEYFDILGNTVIYHPWIIDNANYLLPPSIYAAALLSRLGDESNFFKSVANRELNNTHDVEYELTHDELAYLSKNRVNPVLNIPHRGVRLWGIKTFDETMDTLNELRVMKLIKRKIKRISKMYLFEPNDMMLQEKIKFLVAILLDKLLTLGALKEYNINSPTYEEQQQSEKLVIEIMLGFSTPIEYINIRLNKVEKENIVLTVTR